MAHRDKTQGFGFVYVDLKKILAQRDHISNPQNEPQNELVPEGTQSVNFNKDPLPVAPDANTRQRAQAITQIRTNLDRLQSLHHKLHAILEDLNKITDSDNKKKR
jgi:hypothetical protein